MYAAQFPGDLKSDVAGIMNKRIVSRTIFGMTNPTSVRSGTLTLISLQETGCVGGVRTGPIYM